MKFRSVLKGLLLSSAVASLTLFVGCGPTYPNCDTDEHCEEYGEYCVDKQCRQCRADEHCNADDACKVCGAGYTCVTRSGCCHSDLDCARGVCRKAAGDETGDCYGNCKDDSHCPAGQKCAGNMCVPKDECTPGGGECGAGFECVDGRCVEMCRPDPVYFDYNESRIRTDQKPSLERAAECIRKRAQSVTVQGHCDERGTDEYNLALGQRRAARVKRYLERLGIAKGTLGTLSYGEERPVCSESYESCWWRNRRAEYSFK